MSDTEQRFRLAMPKDLTDKSIVVLNKSGVNHAMGYDVRDMVTNSDATKFAVTETSTAASVEKPLPRTRQGPADETTHLQALTLYAKNY